MVSRHQWHHDYTSRHKFSELHDADLDYDHQLLGESHQRGQSNGSQFFDRHRNGQSACCDHHFARLGDDQ